jgi:hypothetical protein
MEGYSINSILKMDAAEAGQKARERKAEALGIGSSG